MGGRRRGVLRQPAIAAYVIHSAASVLQRFAGRMLRLESLGFPFLQFSGITASHGLRPVGSS